MTEEQFWTSWAQPEEYSWQPGQPGGGIPPVFTGHPGSGLYQSSQGSQHDNYLGDVLKSHINGALFTRPLLSALWSNRVVPKLEEDLVGQ